MNDPLPPLIAGFDQLGAMIRPVAEFYGTFHRELVNQGLSRQEATVLVGGFMRPFAELTWHGST